MKTFILATSLLLTAMGGYAIAADSIEIYPSNPRQGDAVVAVFNGVIPKEVLFDGKPVPVFKYRGGYRAVFGLPWSISAGNHVLRSDFGNGNPSEKNIAVGTAKFKRIALGIPKKLDLTPKALVVKLGEEKKALANVMAVSEPQAAFDRAFGLPLRDNRWVTSPFGEVRVTGTEEIRHLGTDFWAPKGAAVGAINAGVVRKAYYDTVYGNTVIVDHGAGIFSLYMHLQKYFVKDGDRVSAGTLIGTVGDSGYASDSHLHLSLKIGGTSVDPFRFVSVFR